MNEQNINNLVSWISGTVATVEPYDTVSFIEGLSEFCYSFAVWRDGEQYFGSQGNTFRELQEAIKRYCESNPHRVGG